MCSMASDLRLALDVDHFARCAGLDGPLDPWQKRVLEADEAKMLLNCSRQSGKSTVAALLACRAAVYEPRSLILCVSPSLRQSGELFRKVLGYSTGCRRSLRCMLRARCGWSSRTAAG